MSFSIESDKALRILWQEAFYGNTYITNLNSSGCETGILLYIRVKLAETLFFNTTKVLTNKLLGNEEK